MDKEILNNMPEYVKSLPKAVQDLVFDGAWEERTAEIAKKYSLSDTQADGLINTVLYVLIGLENPNTFLETIISDLGISRLLAEQIMEDLEVRVFEYALRTVQKKQDRDMRYDIRDTIKEEPKKPGNPTPTQKVVGEPTVNVGLNVSKTVFDTKPKVPEVKPDNLPMIELGEVVHDSPRQPLGPTPKLVQVRLVQNDVKPEPAQRPVPVPRFTAVPMREDEEEEMSKSKLPTSNQNQNIKTAEPIKIEQPKPEPTKPEHKYTVDPYREPLE